MATKQEWKDYIKEVKAYVRDLEKWLKKQGDVVAEDGSNPPPPPPPPPGH